jgi:hypothetical protein
VSPRLLATVAAAAILAGAGILAGAVAHASESCAQATARAVNVTTTSTVPLPDGWLIAYRCGASEHGGTADSTHRLITLAVQQHHSTDDMTWTWLHELGHAWDMAGGLDRGAWAWLRGLDVDGWWHADPWWNAGGEDFAEAFAHCHLPQAARAGDRWQPPSEVQCGLAVDAYAGVR